MAASVTKIATWILQTRNTDQTGSDLVMELHRIKYDSDATVEVPTSLGSVDFVLVGPTSDVSAPTANVLGSDRVITSGAVTVGATASNSDYFDVAFIGRH